MYNKRTTRITPLLGKHTKKIVGGAWNSANQLALISEDKTVSLNQNNGDLVRQETLKGIPSEVFLPQRSSGKNAKSELISALITNKHVIIINLANAGAPMELAFVPKYGDIVCHRWIQDEYLVVGFSGGWITVVAPGSQNAGEEIFAGQLFRAGITDIQVCEAMRRVAVCGDRGVKFLDCVTWKEIPEDMISLTATCEKICWTSDGNVLTVGTMDGSVYNYLARMPVLNAASGTTIAYLSSLREVIVKDAVDEQRKSLAISIKMEPSFMGLGRNHVAMGMNNMCWFYACDK
jgi:WD repeat-containing protein 19